MGAPTSCFHPFLGVWNPWSKPRTRFWSITYRTFFSPQIERKRSKEYSVIILAGKESFERFSCLEFVFEKGKHREAGLKHKLKHETWRLRLFRDTLILVFLSLYMFHRIIFLLLIVSSLSCNFNHCADCFQSFSEHRLQEYSKCRALNH